MAKHVHIDIRVTEEQKEKIAENARRHNMNMSEWLLHLGLGTQLPAMPPPSRRKRALRRRLDAPPGRMQ